MSKNNKKNFPKPSQVENPYNWTSTEEYPGLIRRVSDNYDFKFTANELDELEKRLSKFPKQTDSLCPVSVAIWPSKNPMRGLSAWLIDQAKKEGVNIGLCVFDNQFYLTEESYKFCYGQPVLKPVIIDIKRSRVIYLEEDGSWQKKSLGIEIISFLALNPTVIKLLDNKNLPYIRMSGVRICQAFQNLEPIISYDGDFSIKFEPV